MDKGSEQHKPVDTDKLITQCQGLVRNLAWKIHRNIGGRIDLDDLIGYGQVGLAEAASRFDPSKNNQFSTYAYHRIRGAILDGLKQMNWFNPSDFHASRYENMAHAVLETDDRQERDSLEHDAQWLADVSSKLVIVYLASTLENENRSIFSEVADDSASSPDAQAIGREMKLHLRRLIEELPSQARSLIRWTYYEGATLKAAGERLGISKSWASRLHDKTLKKLAKGLSIVGQESHQTKSVR